MVTGVQTCALPILMDKVGEWYEVDVNGWHGFVKDANVTLDAPLPD